LSKNIKKERIMKKEMRNAEKEQTKVEEEDAAKQNKAKR